jgi:hypothetical protein
MKTTSLTLSLDSNLSDKVAFYKLMNEQKARIDVEQNRIRRELFDAISESSELIASSEIAEDPSACTDILLTDIGGKTIGKIKKHIIINGYGEESIKYIFIPM